MEMIKIKSIKKVGVRDAYDLVCEKNHNFILKNGILTHNTKPAQESLRNIMETYASNARFILTANNVNKAATALPDHRQL